MLRASRSCPNAGLSNELLRGSAATAARCGREWSSGAFEPLERLVDFQAADLGVVTLLALAIDHIFGCAGDEIGIGELTVDTGDIGLHPRQLFLQTRLLGRDVDDVL